MAARLPYILASILPAILALSGCAGGDPSSAHQASMVPPQPAARSEPGGTAFVAALDALALASGTFAPPPDRHSQPPTDDAFRQAAADTAASR